MSIRKGNYLIAGNGANGLQMFDFKWSDHTITDPNWLLSSSNSWQSGNTYKKMYNHLENDYHNGVSGSETIATYTISYMLAPDGHKIVDSVSSEVVDNIYNATGIAWYYVLDTNNKQFKLPRTKYAFDSGTTSEIGKYVEPTLPNITGKVDDQFLCGVSASSASSGAIKLSDQKSNSIWGSNSASRQYDFEFDASKSNSIYQNNATVQPPATKMLLYFYTEQFAGNGGGSGGGSVSVSYDSTNKRLIFSNEG